MGAVGDYQDEMQRWKRAQEGLPLLVKIEVDDAWGEFFDLTERDRKEPKIVAERIESYLADRIAEDLKAKAPPEEPNPFEVNFVVPDVIVDALRLDGRLNSTPLVEAVRHALIERVSEILAETEPGFITIKLSISHDTTDALIREGFLPAAPGVSDDAIQVAEGVQAVIAAALHRSAISVYRGGIGSKSLIGRLA